MSGSKWRYGFNRGDEFFHFCVFLDEYLSCVKIDLVKIYYYEKGIKNSKYLCKHCTLVFNDTMQQIFLFLFSGTFDK